MAERLITGHRCSGVSHVYARCEDCGWETNARNGVGNAARHAYASGHHVTFEQVVTGAYNCNHNHERPDA